MAQDLFVPRADIVDDELFVETRQTATATAALWTVLGLSRQQPRPWLPTVVLCGEPGSGRTTVARRFCRATQRSVACDLVQEALADFEPAQARRDAIAKADAVRWAEDMVREHGGDCPGICRPAAWVPESMIAKALEAAQDADPAVTVEMPPRPDRARTWLRAPNWRSPGNLAHHPTRRTSVMIADAADRLLSVPPTRRRACLDEIERWDRVVKHPVTLVLIGTPALAEAVAEYRTTQVIRIDAMPEGEEFANVVAMIFGTRDSDEIAALHRQSRGLMGRLVHIARLRGLAPPYRIPPDEILRLPSPSTGCS